MTYGRPSAFFPQVEVKNTKTLEKIIRNYRMTLRRAERFYLDDDFVEMTMELARDFDKVKRWSNLARLPFDTIWLEMDCHVKVRNSMAAGVLLHAEEFSEDSTPRRMGFLMQNINQETGAWAATQVMGRNASGPVTLEPVTYFFAPEGPSHDVMRPPKPWTLIESLALEYANHLSRHDPDFEKKREEIIVQGREAFENYAHIALGITGKPEEKSRGTGFAVIPEFHNRVNIGREPLAVEAFNEKLRDKPFEYVSQFTTQLGQVFTASVRENAGLYRMLFAMLATINSPAPVKHYFPAQPGYRTFRSGPVPYLGHHLITLKLPRTKPIAYLHGILKKESDERRKQRWHRVRGHYRLKDRGVFVHCKHDATVAEDGTIYCLRCEHQLKWIADHAKGDPTLGIVNHDYLVEASGG